MAPGLLLRQPTRSGTWKLPLLNPRRPPLLRAACRSKSLGSQRQGRVRFVSYALYSLPPWPHVRVYIYICIYIHISVRGHYYTYVYACIQICLLMCVYIRIPQRKPECVCVYAHLHTFMRSYAYVCKYIYIYIYNIYTYIYIHTCVYVHIYMDTCTSISCPGQDHRSCSPGTLPKLWALRRIPWRPSRRRCVALRTRRRPWRRSPKTGDWKLHDQDSV